MNNFTNASRVLKQVESLSKNHIFDSIDIIALGSKQLPDYQELNNDIRLYRIRTLTRSLPKNLIFQGIKYLEFSTKSIFFILKKKPDVINVHSLGVLPIGVICKTILNNVLIYDTHELETEKNGLFGIKKVFGKLLEKTLINKVDMIFVVSESIAKWYVNEYNVPKPTVILNTPRLRELQSHNLFREKFGIRSDQTIVLYQGGLMPGRGLKQILDAFKAREGDDIVLVIMGYGILEQNIINIANESKNIYFLPAVSPEVVLDYTSSADIGISLIENICLSYYYCMPNKLFEYSMVGIPVIVSNMKEISTVVEKHHMGFVLSDFSSKSINSLLDNIVKQDIKKMGERAYQFVLHNNWEKQEIKMLKSYKNLLRLYD